MYDSVRSNWQKFSSKFEGYLPFMYLDVKGLVTTGMGNLIDPLPQAQALPWRKPDGSFASPNEIGAAWSLVKGRQDMKMKGGGAFSGISDLRLDQAGIQQLINGKLDNNDKILLGRFPGMVSWPADAQMGVHSMAWAMGANFHFPKFEAAVNSLVPDFKEAAIQSHMNDVGNPGLVPRNAANVQLFNNAQYTLDNGLPHDVLQWAEGLVTSAVSAVSDAASSAADVAAQAGTAVVKAPLGVKALVGVGLLVVGGGFTAWTLMKGGN